MTARCVARLVGLNRHADPLVLTLAEEEATIGFQLTGPPAPSHQFRSSGEHHRSLVGAGWQLNVFEGAALPVADDQPARLITRRQCIYAASASLLNHCKRMPKGPPRTTNGNLQYCIYLQSGRRVRRTRGADSNGELLVAPSDDERPMTGHWATAPSLRGVFISRGLQTLGQIRPERQMLTRNSRPASIFHHQPAVPFQGPG